MATMSLCMSRRSVVVPCTRSRAVAPALVRRVDIRSSRLVQARSNMPKSDEATETQETETQETETQAVDKATMALGFIGALALSGAISIAGGIVPTSALAGLGASYKTYNVTTFNIPPALIDQRFVQANSGCNPEVSRNSSGQVTDLKFVYVSCPPGVTCNAYPYPTYNPLYESQITTAKVSALNNPPPQYSNIWIRCFV